MKEMIPANILGRKKYQRLDMIANYGISTTTDGRKFGRLTYQQPLQMVANLWSSISLVLYWVLYFNY